MSDPSRFPYPHWVRCPAGSYRMSTEAELEAMRADFLDRWARALPQANAAVREFVAEMKNGGAHAGPR